MKKLIFIVLTISILIVVIALNQENTPVHKSEEDIKKVTEDQVPGARVCSSCHLSIYEKYEISPHGKAGVDCASCHTFSRDLLNDPDEYLKEGFYQDVTISECKRCHGVQYEEWQAGRHVDPLTIFYLNISGRDDSNIPYTSLEGKQENPCLSCHQPHPVESD